MNTAAPTPPAAATKPPVTNGSPPTPAAAAEVAPPETAKPKDDGEAKLLQQLRQREKVQLEREQRWRREQQQEAERLSRERAEVAAWRQEQQQAREAARRREAEELGQKDPLRWLQTQQQQLLAQYDSKIQALEAKVAEQERAAQSISQREAVNRELEGLSKAAKADSDRSHVAAYAAKADAKFRARALRIAREHIEQGVRLTNDEVLDKMEEELADEASVWSDRGSKSDPATSDVTSAPAQSTGTDTKPAPTLTNAKAAERTRELTEDELAKLSPQERRERTLAMLRQMRADRAAAAAKK